MRRMYSEQELTNTIKTVFDQEVESGVFDEDIANYVDAYLVEHPVDPTAITGLDIAPKDVTASGNITAPSIIENMSGYTFTPATSTEKSTISNVFAGAVKNGNKLTFVIALNLTKLESESNTFLGEFVVPASVYAKLYTSSIGGGSYLAVSQIASIDADFGFHSLNYFVSKSGSNKVTFRALTTSPLATNKANYIRIELTFLLSETLIPA